LAKFGPKKNILVAKNSSISTFFIHLNPFSSTYRAFIQHPDELAFGYILVVPPGRKIKNHRKNTGGNLPKLSIVPHMAMVLEELTYQNCELCTWRLNESQFNTTVPPTDIEFQAAAE
jgi:hypothetical protein